MIGFGCDRGCLSRAQPRLVPRADMPSGTASMMVARLPPTPSDACPKQAALCIRAAFPFALILQPRSISYPGSQLCHLRCSAKWQDQDCSRVRDEGYNARVSGASTPFGMRASLLLTSHVNFIACDEMDTCCLDRILLDTIATPCIAMLHCLAQCRPCVHVSAPRCP